MGERIQGHGGNLAEKMSTLADIMALVVAEWDGAPPHSLGKTARNVHCSPPQVFWTPVGNGTFLPAGGNSSNPRSLKTREIPVEIHFWASTEDELETMMDSEVAAIHNATVGSYDLKRWASTEGEGDIDTHGHGAVIEVGFRVPIEDRTWPVVTNPTLVHETIFEFPGGDESCGHAPEDP